MAIVQGEAALSGSGGLSASAERVAATEGDYLKHQTFVGWAGRGWRPRRRERGEVIPNEPPQQQ